MMSEVKNSRVEFQTLQADKNALEISAEKTENNAQDILAELQKLQLEHQMLKTKREDIQLSYENLRAEKNMLQSKVFDLEMGKDTIEEKDNQYQIEVAALEEKTTSLTASLKDDMEQKIDIQDLKEHILTQTNNIHQLQICIEDERCKISQIDTGLEKILDTTSYFLDRSQDILEILIGRMVWEETDKEYPMELSVKHQQSLKQEYELS